jgi:hypothetical protein
MDRKKGILAAGTFTGLILITILALGFGSLRTSSAVSEATTPPTAEVAAPAANSPDADQALQEWQTYSAELEQTIQTLLERDALYQQQLDTANETITSLQDEVNAANSASYHEEEEHEEYEEYEHEEYDD